jgi:hypothetical protein
MQMLYFSSSPSWYYRVYSYSFHSTRHRCYARWQIFSSTFWSTNKKGKCADLSGFQNPAWPLPGLCCQSASLKGEGMTLTMPATARAKQHLDFGTKPAQSVVTSRGYIWKRFGAKARGTYVDS